MLACEWAYIKVPLERGLYVTWLRKLFGIGKKRPQKQVSARAFPVDCCAVLIDMPNVVAEGYNVQGSPYKPDWLWFMYYLQRKEIGSTIPLLRQACDKLRGDDHEEVKKWYEQAKVWWETYDYEFIADTKGDIDSFIGVGIMKAAALADDQKMKKLRIVLVSGDSIHLRGYHTAQKLYKKKGLELELVVYSWDQSMSRELARAAGPGNTRSLENLNGLL